MFIVICWCFLDDAFICHSYWIFDIVFIKGFERVYGCVYIDFISKLCDKFIKSYYLSVIYKDAVLKAVNLGDDTDTTACVTGAIAGLYYGIDSIPQEWLNKLAKKEMIEDIADRIEEMQ